MLSGTRLTHSQSLVASFASLALPTSVNVTVIVVVVVVVWYCCFMNGTSVKPFESFGLCNA